MNTSLSQLILTADYDGTVDECIDFGEEPSVDYQQIHVAELTYEPYAPGVERCRQLRAEFDAYRERRRAWLEFEERNRKSKHALAWQISGEKSAIAKKKHAQYQWVPVRQPVPPEDVARLQQILVAIEEVLGPSPVDVS